jgi:hypothetical protein
MLQAVWIAVFKIQDGVDALTPFGDDPVIESALGALQEAERSLSPFTAKAWPLLPPIDGAGVGAAPLDEA